MKKETKMTLNQLVNDWILKKKETLRHSSLCIYKNIIYKEILPFFESHNLTNLNLYEFTNMINQKIKDEKISYRYALNIITLLKSQL